MPGHSRRAAFVVAMLAASWSEPALAQAGSGLTPDIAQAVNLQMRAGRPVDSCGAPVTPRIQRVDLNGDGTDEVFVLIPGTCEGGIAGGYLTLLVRAPGAAGRAILAFPLAATASCRAAAAAIPTSRSPCPAPVRRSGAGTDSATISCAAARPRSPSRVFRWIGPPLPVRRPFRRHRLPPRRCRRLSTPVSRTAPQRMGLGSTSWPKAISRNGLRRRRAS